MANSIGVSEARDEFAELVNKVAYGNERVRVARRGRDIAAIVPIADINLLEALEDELDLAAARAALADRANRERVAWDEVRARLDL